MTLRNAFDPRRSVSKDQIKAFMNSYTDSKAVSVSITVEMIRVILFMVNLGSNS